MNNRLDSFLISEQLSPSKFADLLGVQRSSISHIISGRNKPSFDFIAKFLIKFPSVNPEWLILGKGDMYKKVVQTSLFDDSEINTSPLEHERRPNKLTDYEMEKKESEQAGSNITNIQSEEIQPVVTDIFEKEIDRIIVFYKDRTFKSYKASED